MYKAIVAMYPGERVCFCSVTALEMLSSVNTSCLSQQFSAVCFCWKYGRHLDVKEGARGCKCLLLDFHS